MFLNNKDAIGIFDTGSKTFQSVSAIIYAYFTWIRGLSGALIMCIHFSAPIVGIKQV